MQLLWVYANLNDEFEQMGKGDGKSKKIEVDDEDFMKTIQQIKREAQQTNGSK